MLAWPVPRPRRESPVWRYVLTWAVSIRLGASVECQLHAGPQVARAALVGESAAGLRLQPPHRHLGERGKPTGRGIFSLHVELLEIQVRHDAGPWPGRVRVIGGVRDRADHGNNRTSRRRTRRGPACGCAGRHRSGRGPSSSPPCPRCSRPCCRGGAARSCLAASASPEVVETPWTGRRPRAAPASRRAPGCRH